MKKIEIKCKICGRERMLTPKKAAKINLCYRCEKIENENKKYKTITCQHPGCKATRVVRTQHLDRVKYCLVHAYQNNADKNKEYVKNWRAKQKLKK